MNARNDADLDSWSLPILIRLWLCNDNSGWFLEKELKIPRIITDATAKMENIVRFVPSREGTTVLYVAQTLVQPPGEHPFPQVEPS